MANRGPSDARELIKPSYIVAENVTFRSYCEFPCTTTDRVRMSVSACVRARTVGREKRVASVTKAVCSKPFSSFYHRCR